MVLFYSGASGRIFPLVSHFISVHLEFFDDKPQGKANSDIFQYLGCGCFFVLFFLGNKISEASGIQHPCLAHYSIAWESCRELCKRGHFIQGIRDDNDDCIWTVLSNVLCNAADDASSMRP